jgi:metal-sulfur cluster biosynthetic enzyme
MTEAAAESYRLQQVWARLDTVTDPELDEPVTTLGFINAVTLEPDGVVAIDFRLPTYWCSPNFAYLMADDMRVALSALSWVSRVEPRLCDHMAAAEISAGVAAGRSFKAIFGDAAQAETLDEVRATFRRKAFQRRQEALLRSLLAAGWTGQALLALTLADLTALALPADPAVLRERYLALRTERAADAAQDAAFITPGGEPIAPAAFDAHLQTLRMVRLNMEFNGAICRGLLAARYGSEATEPENETAGEAPPDEPGLADFIAGRVVPKGSGSARRRGAVR